MRFLAIAAAFAAGMANADAAVTAEEQEIRDAGRLRHDEP